MENTGAIIITNENKESFFKELENRFVEAGKKLLNIQEREDLLTQEEASKLLSITKATLISYQKKGKVKAHHLGRRVYYKRSELLNFQKIKTEKI